jgi:hypothetical protein
MVVGRNDAPGLIKIFSKNLSIIITDESNQGLNKINEWGASNVFTCE